MVSRLRSADKDAKIVLGFLKKYMELVPSWPCCIGGEDFLSIYCGASAGNNDI